MLRTRDTSARHYVGRLANYRSYDIDRHVLYDLAVCTFHAYTVCTCVL